MVIEGTADGFAQDNYCKVWYLGEIMYDLENCLLVSIDATSTVEVSAAKAGIAVEGTPIFGETYRLECAISVIHGPV